jgi:hypothetical protein
MDASIVNNFHRTARAASATLRAVAWVAAFVLCSTSIASAQAAAETSDAPVCIYQDRAFSAGAAICPHARFMLMCSQENDKLVWKIVSDTSLSNRCLAPTIRADAPPPRRFIRRASVVRPPAPPVATASSAKCFTFNNKQYCE